MNLHYRSTPTGRQAGFVGLLGGTAEWVFVKPGMVSVTISAANRLVDRPRVTWRNSVAGSVPRSRFRNPCPPWRVVKEKRATFAATPAENRKRPGTRTAWRTWSWPVTGPTRACPPPSKGRSGPAKLPRRRLACRLSLDG